MLLGTWPLSPVGSQMSQIQFLKRLRPVPEGAAAVVHVPVHALDAPVPVPAAAGNHNQGRIHEAIGINSLFR